MDYKKIEFCSNEYFNTLYPEFNINDLNYNNDNIYLLKNIYHKNNINKKY